MKKIFSYIAVMLPVLFLVSGCSHIGDKTTSMSIIYGVTAVFSLALLISYCCFIKKKEIWFLLFFASVFIVNIGYFTLSVSYIISELFLISLYVMIQDQEKRLQQRMLPQTNEPENKSEEKTPEHVMSASYIEWCLYLEEHISELTATERLIYNCYLDGKSTKEILKELNITENTLKFHNKNLYTKLGVSSRKQIVEYVKALKKIKAKETQAEEGIV